MKKFLVILAAVVFLLPLCARAAEPKAAEKSVEKAAEKSKEFVVYSDKNAQGNHYIPSGFMGDYGDISLDDQSTDNPHGGTNCMKFTYSAKKSQNQGWAGVYWQNPPNNWGSKKGGFDLTGMTKLTFWARGAKGGEIIDRFKVGGLGMLPKALYPDSAEAAIGPIELTDSWKQYTINLAGKDLSYISGGFCWVVTGDQNPNGSTFYLDDIKFEVDPTMKAESKKQETMPFYVYSDARSAHNHYIPSGWMPNAGTAKDIKFANASKEDPYLGDTCIKIDYKDVSGNRWAGIYWQNPANNWGTLDGGYDLAKAGKFTFWARGAKGGERIEEFKVGGIMGEYSDSDSASIGPVVLNKEWTQYTIDLKGKDMSYVIGGFCWATNVDVNPQPEGITFYLDELKYE